MLIRNATVDDLDEVSFVEAQCFPVQEAATAEVFSQRLKYYGNHFWLMFDEERLISFVDGFVTNEPNLTVRRLITRQSKRRQLNLAEMYT